MKYLLFVPIAIFCTGFTICDKYVKTETGWQIYIYPDCSDTTTYIIQSYVKTSPYKTRRNGGKWIEHKGEYSVSEALYFHGLIMSESGYNIYDNSSHFNETFYSKDLIRESYWKHPSRRQLSIGKHTFLQIKYFDDGTVSGYTIDTPMINGSELTEAVEWDKMHKVRWKGSYKHTYTSENTEEFMDEKTGIANILTVRHDSLIKSGVWKKYNNDGQIIDSAYYLTK